MKWWSVHRFALAQNSKTAQLPSDTTFRREYFLREIGMSYNMLKILKFYHITPPHPPPARENITKMICPEYLFVSVGGGCG